MFRRIAATSAWTPGDLAGFSRERAHVLAAWKKGLCQIVLTGLPSSGIVIELGPGIMPIYSAVKADLPPGIDWVCVEPSPSITAAGKKAWPEIQWLPELTPTLTQPKPVHLIIGLNSLDCIKNVSETIQIGARLLAPLGRFVHIADLETYRGFGGQMIQEMPKSIAIHCIDIQTGSKTIASAILKINPSDMAKRVPIPQIKKFSALWERQLKNPQLYTARITKELLTIAAKYNVPYTVIDVEAHFYKGLVKMFRTASLSTIGDYQATQEVFGRPLTPADKKLPVYKKGAGVSIHFSFGRVIATPQPDPTKTESIDFKILAGTKTQKNSMTRVLQAMAMLLIIINFKDLTYAYVRAFIDRVR